jgi:hypothetical protein
MSVKLLVTTSKRRGSALLGRFGNTAFWLLVVVYMAVPVPEGRGSLAAGSAEPELLPAATSDFGPGGMGASD